MERNGIEYDPETNLPKLREGLFWKIHRVDATTLLNISIVTHQIRYKHSFLGIKWGEYDWYPEYRGLYTYTSEAFNDDRIRTEAERIYQKLVEAESIEDWLTEREGVYPPNKL